MFLNCGELGFFRFPLSFLAPWGVLQELSLFGNSSANFPGCSLALKLYYRLNKLNERLISNFSRRFFI